MSILTEPKAPGILIVCAFLTQGCTTKENGNFPRVNEEIVLATAAPASEINTGLSQGHSRNSYVADSADGVVMSAEDECVRTIHWLSAKANCKDAEPVVVEEVPDVAPTPPVGPGSVLVSYNGRALFDFDSATLSGAGLQQLDELTAKLNAQDEIEAIEIVGHADSIGSDAYNQTLSENRAEAVKVYLQRSLRNVTVQSKGLGESAPIADNSTEEGRRMNRRVEVNIAAMVEK